MRISLNLVLLLLLVKFFCERVQVRIGECVPHQKYQVKPHSSALLVIVAKGFLKLPNLHMLIKQKSPSRCRNSALWTFCKLPIVFSIKVKSALPHVFNGPEVLSFASDKAKLCAENFSKNSNIDDHSW